MKNLETRRRAEALEREAEHMGDPGTWVVASDAWLEAGDLARAWYARLRSRDPYGTSLGRLITRERAEKIARAVEEEAEANLPMTRRVANEERGALELFKFMAFQPERVFAYYDAPDPTTHLYVGDGVRSFVGNYLGTIVHRGKVAYPFGNRNARIQHVRVRAINGYMYQGTCAIDNGTYCKLRRGKPWLR